MSTDKREKSLLALGCILFTLASAEVFFGVASHSLVLIVDGVHLISDIASLFIVAKTIRLSKKGPTNKYTFGMQRFAIVGAFLNSTFLFSVAFMMFIEAITRFISHEVVESPIYVIILGCCGLLANGLGLYIIGLHGHSHDGGLSACEGNHGGGHGHSHNHGHSHGHSHSQDSFVNENHHGQEHSDSDGESVNFDNDEDDDYVQLLATSSNSNMSLLRKRSLDCNMDEGHVNIGHGHSHSPSSKPQHDDNMYTVLIHVAMDFLGSICVIINGCLNYFLDSEYVWLVDPCFTLFISFMLCYSLIPVIKRNSDLVILSSPDESLQDHLESSLNKLFIQDSVKELHIWEQTPGNTFVIGKIVVPQDMHPDAMKKIDNLLKENDISKHYITVSHHE